MIIFDYLLPIGSILTLKEDDEKRLFMVIGVLQENENGETKDYIAVRYPMGYLDNNLFFVFNHDDMDQVIHRGYEDENYTAFLELLKRIKAKEDS